jgi:hypothetical protein
MIQQSRSQEYLQLIQAVRAITSVGPKEFYTIKEACQLLWSQPHFVVLHENEGTSGWKKKFCKKSRYNKKVDRRACFW